MYDFQSARMASKHIVMTRNENHTSHVTQRSFFGTPDIDFWVPIIHFWDSKIDSGDPKHVYSDSKIDFWVPKIVCWDPQIVFFDPKNIIWELKIYF